MYEKIYSSFKWSIPQKFNIGISCCDKFANVNPEKKAIITEQKVYTYGELKILSNKLCNYFSKLNLKKGDRIGILLSQQIETVIAHLSAYRSGLVAVPLFVLFGEDALEYRINNSGLKVLILNKDSVEKIEKIKHNLKTLKKLIIVGDDKEDDFKIGFSKIIEKASSEFTPVETSSEDPALIIYTSGTTGPPKGALHAHRTLLGHLPGVEISHNFFPKEGDLFWTPADWAWIGGLYDVLFPSLYHGIPVVAWRMKKFEPEYALHFMEKYKIRNVFMPPTALKF